MSTARARHVSWTGLPADQPMPLLERRRLIGEKSMISHITLRKGCDVPMHSHENEQFSCVISGRLRFGVQDGPGGAPRDVMVGPGEAIHLPANVPHSAFAEAETVVLDIFTPPSAATGIDRAGRRDDDAGLAASSAGGAAGASRAGVPSPAVKGTLLPD